MTAELFKFRECIICGKLLGSNFPTYYTNRMRILTVRWDNRFLREKYNKTLETQRQILKGLVQKHYFLTSIISKCIGLLMRGMLGCWEIDDSSQATRLGEEKNSIIFFPPSAHYLIFAFCLRHPKILPGSVSVNS